MCFHSKQSKNAQELENRFHAKFENKNLYQPSIYNAFEYPKTPIITHNEPQKIQLFEWGLIPNWAKDKSIRKNTLNARIETIHEKPSFRNSINNRCLILANGFFEWKWLDNKGKNKEKFLITLPYQEAFAFAGLWNQWIDQETSEIIKTYTILTTEANELMATIHNSKKRMPILVNNESDWLKGQNLIMKNEQLVATKD